MRVRRSIGPGSRSAAAFAAVLLVAGVLAAVPASAAPARPDDTPVRFNPKGVDPGDDDAGYAKLRDDYYWSRLLSGDDGGITPDVAAKLRARATVESSGATPAVTGTAAVPSGAWTAQGAAPVVQVARTSNTFEAVSGRVTALVVRPDGSLIAGGAQGGVWTYDQGTGIWTSRSSDTDTQSVGALAAAPSNPDVVYLGTGEGSSSGDSYYGNGVYRSDNGGVTWRKVSGDQFVAVSSSSIVVDPTDPDHLFLATLRGRAGINRVSPPGTSLFGVWESRDGGGHWTVRRGTTDGLHGATDLVMDPRNPAILWASFWGDGIYRSTDGGANWAPAMGDLPAGDFTEGGTRFALGLAHPAGSPVTTVYAGFDYFESDGTHHASQLYKTTTDGASWKATATGTGTDSILDYCATQCAYDNVVKPDPTDPNVVYVLGQYNYGLSPQSGGIYRTVDGGRTWKNLGYDLHPDYHAIAFQPGNTQHVAIGNDGGIWQSSTGGGRRGAGAPLSSADWENLNGQVDPSTGGLIHSTGLQIGQYDSIATVPNVPGQYWGGTQDNGTQRKSSVNDRWYDLAGGDGGKLIVDQTTPNSLTPGLPGFVFGEYYGISPYRFDSTGAGAFFGNATIDGGIDTTDRAEFYVPIAQNRGNTNQMFLGTYRLYRTDNAETANPGDVHWNAISGDLTSGCVQAAPNGARGCLISAVGLADGGDGVYVGTDDGIVQVSPKGVTSSAPTFTRSGVGTLPNRPVAGFAVDRSNWRDAYAYYAGFSAATPSRPGHVWHTTDGGHSWVNVTGNLPDVPLNALSIDPSNPSTLYAGTDVGVYVTTDTGRSWSKLGASLPTAAVWALDYDATNGVLLAGTHGRGAYTLTSSSTAPALVVRTTDSGKPVGPGSTVHYTLTVRNFGSAKATGVRVKVPLPAHTTFASAGDGGRLQDGKAVVWTNLTIPKGTTTTLTFALALDTAQPAGTTAVIVDGVTVTSAQGAGTVGSQHNTPFAAPRAVSLAPGQTGAARSGAKATYALTVTNTGFQAGKFAVTSTGAWTTKVYDASCTTPLATTATIPGGGSLGVCVTVAVPADAANAASQPSTVMATSTDTPSVSATVTLTTIAVTATVLVVDGDGNAPDVASYYTTALTTAGVSFSYWDLAADPILPTSLLKAHQDVVWFTGTSYPGPIGAYESQLTGFLNGGGRLLLSGQDILDQSAGTSTFVHDFLHVDWDGSETQNDKPTATVTGVSGNVVTDGVGAVPLDHTVLNAAFEDQVTPIAPATAAFTDDTGAADGLTVATGGYKVVFLAFPFEEYGSAAQKAALMTKVVSYFG